MSIACLFIGARFDDPHTQDIPGRRVVWCADCGYPTMFTPGSFNHENAAHPGTRFVCIECAVSGAADGLTLIPPSREQRAEVERIGGFFALSEMWGRILRVRR